MSQHISVFQERKHSLILAAGYTGANEKHRMSTVVDSSVLRVKKSKKYYFLWQINTCQIELFDELITFHKLFFTNFSGI